MAESPVKAEIAAAVWKIEAGPGARVAEGDAILLLESMKMEIPVAAPRSGRVKAVLVAEGDLVEEGQVVAMLEH
jgi:acetyl-CoA carboxylase biotin carboxyl carrier protein